VEIAEAVGMDNIFIFGMTAPEVNELWRAGYNSTFFYNSNQDLKEVMKSFNKGFDNQSFEDITAYLLTGTAIADAYMCLADYDSYMKAYHYMDEVYQDQRLFNRMSLINISEAGRFAADRSIEEYAQRIWHLKKVK
jgi:starch phosphorylase